MAQYSLFVLKVPLNPKQTNKQTSIKLANPVSRGKMAFKTERECSPLVFVNEELFILRVCCGSVAPGEV